jgi:AcrR family transcriptional regulator
VDAAGAEGDILPVTKQIVQYLNCVIVAAVSEPSATSGGNHDASRRHAGGRPRLPDTDRAILEAVTGLLREVGAARTSINAVAARSGVARGTVYRRWPNRSAMIAAAIRETRGIDPQPFEDDAVRNLRRQAELTRTILAEPGFRAIMPTILELVLSGAPDPVIVGTVFPNRLAVREMYRAVAASSGLRTDVDPDVVNAAIVGSLLYLLFATGSVPSATDAQAVVDLVLDGLRPRGPARPTAPPTS